MESRLLVTKLIKKNGRLVFKSAVDLAQFNHFAAQVKEGQTIEQYTNFSHEDGLLSQLAKVHAMIRDISKETGDTFLATKNLIKKDCGLVALNGELKSFGACSFEDLSAVIQHCIEVGDFLNIQLR